MKRKMRPEQIDNRKRIVEISQEAGTSHLGSALSVVDIIEAIYASKRPEEKFVLSNGHAASALYVILERYGLLTDPDIKKLGVHPERNPALGIEVSTGSLGQGLSIAVGMAMANRKRNVYCCISDGECAEGSVWEALRNAYQQKLDNLKIIINANGFGGYDAIDLEVLLTRLQSHGCAAVIVDGHNLEELKAALAFKVINVPLVLFAKTTVEQIPALSGLGAHYKVLTTAESAQAIRELSRPSNKEYAFFREIAEEVNVAKAKVRQLRGLCEALGNNKVSFELPDWGLNALRATKMADGEWIIQLLQTNGTDGPGRDNIATYFVEEDGRVAVVHLDITNEPKNHSSSVKRKWYWGERPSFDKIGAMILAGEFPEAKVNNLDDGGGGHYTPSPFGLISLLQRKLVEKVGEDEKVDFGGYVTEKRVGFRNYLRYFIDTCRRFPEEMANASTHLGNNFRVFDKIPALVVALELANECGLKDISGKPLKTALARTLRETEGVMLSEGFRLLAPKRISYDGEILEPDFWLSFRRESAIMDFREVGTRLPASKAARQLRGFCELLAEERGIGKIKVRFNEPFEVTRYSDRTVMIRGVICEYPEDQITVKRFLALLIDGDDTVNGSYMYIAGGLREGTAKEIIQGIEDLGKTDPAEFRRNAMSITTARLQFWLEWLLNGAVRQFVTDLAEENGDEVYGKRRDLSETRNTIKYFIQASRDYPKIMEGAEIHIGTEGEEAPFSSEVAQCILETLEGLGLIETKGLLKTNPLVARLLRVNSLQLDNQFKLSRRRDTSEFARSWYLSFGSRQIG